MLDLAQNVVIVVILAISLLNTWAICRGRNHE